MLLINIFRYILIVSCNILFIVCSNCSLRYNSLFSLWEKLFTLKFSNICKFEKHCYFFGFHSVQCHCDSVSQLQFLRYLGRHFFTTGPNILLGGIWVGWLFQDYYSTKLPLGLAYCWCFLLMVLFVGGMVGYSESHLEHWLWLSDLCYYSNCNSESCRQLHTICLSNQPRGRIDQPQIIVYF